MAVEQFLYVDTIQQRIVKFSTRQYKTNNFQVGEVFRSRKPRVLPFKWTFKVRRKWLSFPRKVTGVSKDRGSILQGPLFTEEYVRLFYGIFPFRAVYGQPGYISACPRLIFMFAEALLRVFTSVFMK